MSDSTIQEIIDIFNRDYPTASDETYEFFYDVLNVLRNANYKWVSVKDRLPEKDMPVMTYHEKGFMCIDIWKGNMWAIAWFNDEYTHWMPLPTPPKSKESEDDEE